MESRKRRTRPSSLRGLLESLFVPFQALISDTAQKAYLGTALFALTSFALLGVSIIAFWLFYWEFVPQPGVERTFHLQFGHRHPYADVSFQNALVSQQAYDIAVLLHVPRTPTNLQTGNFMLSVSLYSSPDPSLKSSAASFLESLAGGTPNGTVGHSSRPAILTYTSPLTSTANTFLSLPFYVTGLSKESEAITVPMFEGNEFSRAALPQSARLVIQADEKMQFYSVGLRIIAKLSGLRWLLYNHRIFSFIVFTTIFWTSSMLSMGVVWLFISVYFDDNNRDDAYSLGDGKLTIKSEDDLSAAPTSPVTVKSEEGGELTDPASVDDLSDASRTFPTLGRQMPMRYSASTIRGQQQQQQQEQSSASIKKEEEEARAGRVSRDIPIQPLQTTAAEADDEDELEDEQYEDTSGFRDSGIGTGREGEGSSRRGREGLLQRRRKSGDSY